MTVPFLDADMQAHLRECRDCEVVTNAAGKPRILACGWWYARACCPPWPPPINVTAPTPLADVLGIWDAKS